MSERAPIHLGSGEPMLLLHPILLSQSVWKDVAPIIANTGRYEVYAPTMLSHNGGRKGPFHLSIASMADDVERRLDDLGWDTAHVVGNSLGGWVAFELECRGRVRTLTGIAPGGGWRRYSPIKFEAIGKFLAGMPLYFVVLLLRERLLKLPITRYLAYLPISGTPDVLSDENLADIIDDVMHCPAYYHLLVKTLAQPGLLEIAEGKSPTHLVNCEKDRVLPHPRFTRAFVTDLPKNTKVTHLDGVGHVPMFEAPQRIADVILEFVDQHAAPPAPTSDQLGA